MLRISGKAPRRSSGPQSSTAKTGARRNGDTDQAAFKDVAHDTAPAIDAEEDAVNEAPVERPRPKTRSATRPQQNGHQQEAVSSRAPLTQPVTFRWRPSLVRALKKASAERSLDYVEPYSQQDIVAEALSAWLEEHGYVRG